MWFMHRKITAMPWCGKNSDKPMIIPNETLMIFLYLCHVKVFY